MKKKIAILGSTSSIGKSLLSIIDKDRKNFKIELKVSGGARRVTGKPEGR